MNNDGLKHIHNVMHAFIEGIAAGVYQSLDDIQADANEYLMMEKAVQKLSNWNESCSVEDLATIFDGLSNSMKRKNEEKQLKEEWEETMQTPPTPPLSSEDIKRYIQQC